MTRRERVMKALSFEEIHAIDMGGMLSTGISCFAYPELVESLGLPPRRPKVHDVCQMLALPDTDVLDALNCDVVSVCEDKWTNAFQDKEKWIPCDFNGRLPALVQNPDDFRIQEDDSILYDSEKQHLKMVPSSYVFDNADGDESFDLMTQDPPREDLKELRAELQAELLTDERVKSIAAYCRRVRESTDRAVMFNGLSMGLKYRNGMASWSMLCLTEPEYVQEVHELEMKHFLINAERLLPEIAPYIDIMMSNSDDQGTQNAPILPPEYFRKLYVPYYRKMNDAVHSLAPGLKSFLHSCGAIYDILDDLIDSGFDVLNPVQWSAGEHSYKEWKDKCRNRIALWGGGINSQSTLPFGTEEEVSREVEEVCRYLKKDGGFVFTSIHNILAEIPAGKVINMYQTAYRTLRASCPPN